MKTQSWLLDFGKMALLNLFTLKINSVRFVQEREVTIQLFLTMFLSVSVRHTYLGRSKNSMSKNLEESARTFIFAFLVIT